MVHRYSCLVGGRYCIPDGDGNVMSVLFRLAVQLPSEREPTRIIRREEGPSTAVLTATTSMVAETKT